MGRSYANLRKDPSAPYVIPFAVFVLLLFLSQWLQLPDIVDAPVRFFLLAAVLYFCSRKVIDIRATRWLPTILLGAGVFVLWIAPDLLWPHYRESWMFHNALLVATAHGSLSVAGRQNGIVLAFRTARAALIVPLVEELFWRAWLMRWLIAPDFRSVRLGTYTAASFWITAILFASEHGSFWAVGLITGIIYNWWMLRTRSLGDLIWTHAITNACLCGYVIATHNWEYWM